MNIPSLNRLNIGPRLTLCFVATIALMLGGDGLLLWQFQTARSQGGRLNGVSQELTAVVRLQAALLSFDENLDKLVQSQDLERLSREAGPLRAALLEDTRQAREALAHLPPGTPVNPTFLPTVEAIDSALPSQLEAITGLASTRDWEAMRLRIASENKPLEAQTALLVRDVEQQVTDDQAEAVLEMTTVQRRILLIVPLTALLTLAIAALLAVGATRSIAVPLGQLMEGSQALAGGDFHHQVSTSGQDELAQLGRAFNQTTDRLRSLYQALQKREAYLAEAQRLGHSGSWALPVGRAELIWSEESFRIFGMDPSIPPTIDVFLERIHPEDRDRFRPLQAKLEQGFDVEWDYRIVFPDGSLKYVHSVGHAVKDSSGAIVEFVGTLIDVTEQWRARSELEDALEELRQRTQALVRSQSYLAEAERLSHSGSWALDMGSRDTFWSEGMFRILDYDPQKIKPNFARFFERVHPQDRPMIEQRARAESTQMARVDSGVDYRIVLEDGTVKHLHSIAHPVMNESGNVVEVIGTTMDVTEPHHAREALQKAFEEIKALKDQLHQENIALREEIDKVSMFEEIVGSSQPLREMLAQVSRVAATDSTVLILGETGTGKEMIARAIHRRSNRDARAFIRVNCAAIPPTLIASELFGHEKGAFTGATQRRLGRFELADGGTIFLDEIGELPGETQSALLRVLQEREFERVGGTQSVSVNVRVLSATNRDLKAAVNAGTFREDLFYRLNVFPIHVPSLRERADDIPLLIEYFIERYAKKAGKKIRNIEKKTMERFQSYQWPGNIRELQNVVERAVVLCDGDTFSVDETWLRRDLPMQPPPVSFPPRGLGRLLPEQEREMIEAALAECGGRVSGPRGAAARLGIPRQTLESKIAGLGINKHRFKYKSA